MEHTTPNEEYSEYSRDHDTNSEKPTRPGHSDLKGDSVSTLSPRVLWWLCFILHLVLVLLHVALFIVWSHHFERRVILPYNSNILSTALTAIQNVFFTTFSATLVVVTQMLAVRQNLLVRQTLTATNDKTSAWSGLRSAFLNLWKQRSVAAAVWGTLTVTAYLVCIAVLHVTTTSLFNVEQFNNTLPGNITTTLALPNVTILPNHDPAGHWVEAGTLLPFFGRTNQATPVGLQGATIYDVPAATFVGNVTVHATTMNVTCGYIDGLSAVSNNIDPLTTQVLNLLNLCGVALSHPKIIAVTLLYYFLPETY